MLVELTINPVPMINIAKVPSESQIMAKFRAVAFPRGIKCPKCRRRYDYKVEGRYFCKRCRYKFSLKTILGFKGSKLSWQTLWVLLECWLSELSPQDTEAITGLPHTTVRRWFRRLAQRLPPVSHQLKGTVEMDEAFIGKRKYGNQVIILGALERTTGKVMLQLETDREQGTLDRFILKNIKPGALVWTDAWSGYDHLTEFFGYGHEVVNHSLGSFGPTNRIENVWMRLRRFIRKVYHHVWREHFPRVLKEFQARISHPEAFQSPLAFLTYVFQQS